MPIPADNLNKGGGILDRDMIEEALFSASAGIFLAVCDALDAPAVKIAIELLRNMRPISITR